MHPPTCLHLRVRSRVALTLGLLGIGIGVVTTLAPRTARACSLGYCDAPIAYPEVDTIPVDHAQVFLHPGFMHAVGSPPPEVELAYAPPGSDVFTAVETTVADVPDETRPRFSVGTSAALAVGGRLRLSALEFCSYEPEPPPSLLLGEWTLGPAMAPPTALGSVQVVAATRAAIQVAGGPGCSYEEVRSYVDLAIAFDASAVPWAERMHLTTWVDGALHVSSRTLGDQAAYGGGIGARGGSVYGYGVDRLVVACGADESSGFAPGEHTVQFRAALPDGTTFATEARTITLACPSPVDPNPDARGCTVGTADGRARLPLAALALALVLRWRRRRSGA